MVVPEYKKYGCTPTDPPPASYDGFMLRPTIALFVVTAALAPADARAEPPTASPDQPITNPFVVPPDVSESPEVALAEGRFDDARRGYIAAYEAEPDPWYLYAAGLAAERAGDCASAGYAFGKYLRTNPPADRRKRAESGVLLCKVLLATAHRVPQPNAPPPPPGGAPAFAAVDKDHRATLLAHPAEPELWRDPWAGVLALTGGVAIGAGIGLARVYLDRDSGNPRSEEEARQTLHLKRATHAMFAIGVVGLSAAAIRYAALSVRQRRARASRLAVVGDGVTLRF